MFEKDKSEVMQDIYEAGGSELPYTHYKSHQKNLPSSMNTIIKEIFKLVFQLNRMVEIEIPRAFPHTESMVNYDPKYKHSHAERLNAVPISILKDANYAIEVAIRLREMLTKARTILVDFYPAQLDHPNFRTELRDKFKYNIEMIDGYISTIEEILQGEKVGLLYRKSENVSQTIDMDQLEHLRNHIIHIGYEKLTSNKDLVELVPNVLTMQNAPSPQPQMYSSQQENAHMENSNNRHIFELSNRLIEKLQGDD